MIPGAMSIAWQVNAAPPANAQAICTANATLFVCPEQDSARWWCRRMPDRRSQVNRDKGVGERGSCAADTRKKAQGYFVDQRRLSCCTAAVAWAARSTCYLQHHRNGWAERLRPPPFEPSLNRSQHTTSAGSDPAKRAWKEANGLRYYYYYYYFNPIGLLFHDGLFSYFIIEEDGGGGDKSQHVFGVGAKGGAKKRETQLSPRR